MSQIILGNLNGYDITIGDIEDYFDNHQKDYHCYQYYFNYENTSNKYIEDYHNIIRNIDKIKPIITEKIIMDSCGIKYKNIDKPYQPNAILFKIFQIKKEKELNEKIKLFRYNYLTLNNKFNKAEQDKCNRLKDNYTKKRIK